MQPWWSAKGDCAVCGPAYGTLGSPAQAMTLNLCVCVYAPCAR